MLLNFAAPRTPVQAVQAPAQPATNIDALLNLAESQYSGLKKVGDTGYYYGNNRMYEPTSYSGGKGAPANMETFGGQNFVPVDADITGFNKSKGEDDIYTYDPSMAYISANRPKSMPAPTPNIMSFLSSPIAPEQSLVPAVSYGAGRFLNNNAMPLNFGMSPRQINTNRYQPTTTSNKEGLNGYGNILNAKTSFGMPIGSPDSMNKIQTLGDFLNTFTFKPRIPIGNSTELNLANMPFDFGKPIGNPSEGNE